MPSGVANIMIGIITTMATIIMTMMMRYEEYEQWLGQIVEGVDSLLDHAPVQLEDVQKASLLGKV